MREFVEHFRKVRKSMIQRKVEVEKNDADE